MQIMIFNNNEIDLIEWCLEQQSIDFNDDKACESIRRGLK